MENVLSEVGRSDEGTEATGVFNLEFGAALAPLGYQYLTSLRYDALPASADELLNMRGRGWLSSFSIDRAQSASLAPRPASSRAVARPIPDDAPVTRTTFPSISKIRSLTSLEQ